MKIRGVLLGTLAEQVAGGDPNPIDPKLVKFDRVEDGDVGVTIGFQQDKLVGKTTRVWREDGRLWFEADVLNDALTYHIEPRTADVSVGAIGIRTDTDIPITAELAYDLEMKDYYGHTIKGGQLFQIGLTDENENRNQPPFEVIDE